MLDMLEQSVSEWRDHISGSDAGVAGEAAGSGPAVLIVDDEAATRRLLKQVVLAVCPSARVHEAADGTTALRFARTHHPALALLDIVLPGSETSGVLLCQELTKIHTPVLIVTAHATGSISQACLEMGAADVLSKPFTAEDAQARVRACLGL